MIEVASVGGVHRKFRRWRALRATMSRADEYATYAP